MNLSKVNFFKTKTTLITLFFMILISLFALIYQDQKDKYIARNMLDSTLSTKGPIQCILNKNNEKPVYMYLESYENTASSIIGNGLIFDKTTCKPFSYK